MRNILRRLKRSLWERTLEGPLPPQPPPIVDSISVNLGVVGRLVEVRVSPGGWLQMDHSIRERYEFLGVEFTVAPSVPDGEFHMVSVLQSGLRVIGVVSFEVVPEKEA